MSEQQIPYVKKHIADDEIDLLALVKTMWNGRRTIFLSVLSGAIIGFFFAIFSPKEFTASSVIVPQLGDSQTRLGGLGGLAALAGINVDVNPLSELSPTVYPQIVSSIPFQLELMNTKLSFGDFPVPLTFYDYFTKYHRASIPGLFKKYTLGLPGVLIDAFKGNSKEIVLYGDSTLHPISLTKEQVRVQKVMEQLVNLELNSKEGYITLTARMPEARAAAQLTQNAQVLLQRYITEFIQGRYNECKAEFEKAQVSLALATDRNKDFTSGLPRIETDRIQTQYTITFTVFQELARQLEQAKIQVKKETPAFAIVKPVTVPSEKSKPNRPLILFIWILLGGFFGTVLVFGKEFIDPVRKRWKDVN
jgi:uncharacterized protein involved in exopolysaccharide biosynthesis